MKNLILLALLLLISVNLLAQEGEATTGEIFLDFSPKKTITIDWLFPSEIDTITAVPEINIRIGYNVDVKIKDISLLLNGLPISTDHRGSGFIMRYHPDYKEFIDNPITLNEGLNHLKFAIRDENGNIEVLERKIAYAKPVDLALANRKDYALLFATDEYDEWNDLINPIKDAKTIAAELEEVYGFETELVTNSNKDDILIKLRDYAQRDYGQYDQLLVFFAGHGQFDDIYGQGYIVGKDSRLNDPAKSSYISHSVLRGIIDNIPSQHTLLVMDVCFGGTFDPLIARGGTRGQDNLYNELATEEFIKRKLRYKTRRYITSGGKEYVSDGRPGQHSPFASQFIEALRNYGGHDKILTLQELNIWLEKIPQEPRVGDFGSNQPGSDFVMVVK